MIAIIDYKAGNLTSVKRALDYLGQESVITSDFSQIIGADRVIFPGVGAAGKAVSDLKAGRLDAALKQAFRAGKPILGICLGTQIILEASQENNAECLGLVKGMVLKFPDDLRNADGRKLKVPHMGWNSVELKTGHPLFEGVEPDSEFYFVHSYYPAPESGDKILGETNYGITFTSVILSDNLVAVQFHPEKSGRPGLKILDNFCRWSGNSNA
ncbi:MAG: imidazole glycerol phosphate synthase subunit HisH [Deltaproteobacteria bacterium]|nr:imidazole glycerol phosphate synthase subunit HisH [Deltaproteobacteria bacterium]